MFGATGQLGRAVVSRLGQVRRTLLCGEECEGTSIFFPFFVLDRHRFE